MLEEYIERKNGRKKFSIHPLLQTILGKTYGVIVYQEELMRVMNTAGLISLQDCEIIRKAMSQKKEDVFMKYKTVFIENGQKTLKWSKEDVEDLWNQMYTFSKYGFNLSHAASYTIVSFRCLWLKTHYPTEYYAAVLSHLQTGDDRVPIYIQDGIEKKNLEFKGVDIDKSKTGYTIEENNIIRIGFDKIKGITKEAHKLIELQPFKSFEDYIERFGCGKTTGERLIKLGAFDNFYKNRKKLLYYLEYIRNSQKASYGMNTNHFRKAYKTINGTKSCPKENSEYFKEVRDKINKNKSSSISYDDIVKIITDGIFDQHIERNTFLEYVIDNKSEFEERITTFDQFEDCEDFSSKERSSFESELYGVSLSDPLDDYRKPENSNIDFIKENGFGKVAVIITGIEQKLSKKKTKYYIMDIKDRTGFMKVTLWENEYIRFSNLLKSGECILIDVVAPKNEFWPWNMQKYGVIKRIRLKNEISEEEEREITYSEEFKKSLSGE
jgi:DNA polymerase-3 subunit alpha